MRRRLNRGLAIGIAGVILAGSIVPVPGGGGTGMVRLTMLGHLTAYFLLAGALLLVFHDTPRGHVEAVAAAVGFGIAMELVQLQVPTRTFAVADVLVNMLGASLVLLDHRKRAVTRVVRWEDRLLARLL